jgi:hypothetical protein
MEQDQDYGANSPEPSTQLNPNLLSLKTLGDSYQRQPIATWNSVRGVWEKNEPSLLCEHWELFSATWPTSGMTQNGQAYELPTPERHTTDSESSSLPTPTTQDNSGKCRDHGGDLLHDLTCGCSRADRRAKLPTPTTIDAKPVDVANQMNTRKSPGLHAITGLLGMPEETWEKTGFLPTPTVFHTTMHDEPIEYFLEREQRSSTGQIGKSLGVAVRMEMLPTPLVDDSKNTGHSKNRIKSLASETYDLGNNLLLPTVTTQDGKNNGGPSQFDRNTLPLNTQVLDNTSWGKFEPAIRRWETVLGRQAPAPTNPDGKDGNHRLSSKFTEWMMGLPNGWITDAGLTRNEELKACGNGVVPQQAELALRMLLK